MKALVLLVALAGCDQVFGLERDTIPCPPEYRAVAGGMYRFVYEPAEWLIADAKCRSHATGATHLVVFDDLLEQQAVLAAVDLPAPWEVAVGYGRDAQSDRRTFYAVTGEVLLEESPLWAVNEPDGPLVDTNGKEIEESIVLSSNFLSLFDAPPKFGIDGYICECDGRAATEAFDVE